MDDILKFADGLKYDQDKLRWDLLPIEEIEDVVKILTFGAQKYSANSWQQLEDGQNRYFAALMRHIVEYRKGNPKDEESGLHHLSHALCNVIFLLWLDKNKKPNEDPALTR